MYCENGRGVRRRAIPHAAYRTRSRAGEGTSINNTKNGIGLDATDGPQSYNLLTQSISEQ